MGGGCWWLGGGISAIEAACTLAEETQAQVSLSHRRQAFTRAKPENLRRIGGHQSSGRIDVIYNSNVKAIDLQSVEIDVEGELKSLPNDDVLVFASGGTEHDGNDCLECHTTGSYEAYECIECHEHAQAPMGNEHDDVRDYRWESTACVDCHPDGESLDRASHSQFPIDSADKHAAVSCGDCHSTGGYEDYSCIDCHAHRADKMNSAHDDVNQYSFTSPACYDCHPDSVVLTRAEHNPFFPITNGDHSRYGCEDCHKTEGTYQDFTCIGCHEGEHTCQRMNNEHQGEVRGYSCEDNACLSCHPDGREDD